MWKVVLASVVGILSGSLGARFIVLFGSRIALIDAPNERSSHSVPTPRGGGVGIWLAFMITGVLLTKSLYFTLFSGTLGLVGLLEDRFDLPPRTRLFAQLILSAMVVGLFLGLPSSINAVLLFLCWVLFVTGTANFYNFMDGINGIAGLTGLVGFGLMAVFAHYIAHQPDITLFSLVLSAACLGFLPFNLPKAKVFMGDVGSVLLGFVFASFVVKLSTSIEVFLCMVMFLCTFYADALVTLFYKWKRGEKLMMAHRSHLYQFMSNELGLPHWKVSLVYALIQLVFGLLAFIAYKHGLTWQIITFGAFGAIFIAFYKIIRSMGPPLVEQS